MVPPEQGLDSDDRTAVEAQLRLVVEDELIGCERVTELARQGEAVRRVGIPLGCVGDHVAVRALRLAEGDVGAAYERARVLAVLGGERDPDARVEADDHALDREGAGQGRAQADRELGRRAAVWRLGEDQPELVPTEPGQGIAAANHLAEAPRHLLQEEVAVVVAERVVHVAEAVEVDEQHGGHHVPGHVAVVVEPPGELGVEPRPVGEPGEDVLEELAPVLLGLVAQAARGAGDDPVQEPVEEDEATQEEEVHVPRVLADGLGDGAHRAGRARTPRRSALRSGGGAVRRPRAAARPRRRPSRRPHRRRARPTGCPRARRAGPWRGASHPQRRPPRGSSSTRRGPGG
jgi:hypothetical protein